MNPSPAPSPSRAFAGRIQILITSMIALVLIALIVLGWLLMSDREFDSGPAESVPPQTSAEPVAVDPAPLGETGSLNSEQSPRRPREPAQLEQMPPAMDRLATEVIEAGPDPVDLNQVDSEIRAELEIVLSPQQFERVAGESLVERMVATLNSLDGEAVPLRFRPLQHVPGLPKLDQDALALPDDPDPRYAPYRAMFDQIDNVFLVEWFDRHENALEQAWQALGEERRLSFRQRAIEVLDHLAEFELPGQRPALERPEVLYTYADPSLEALSWGRKILIRIGPAHAGAVQARLADLARRLEHTSGDDA